MHSYYIVACLSIPKVREGETGSTVALLENQQSPRFTVTGLKPGMEYLLSVTSANSQGSAAPTIITHLTPIDIAEKRLSKSPSGESGIGFPAAIGVLAGALSVLALCCVLVVFVVRGRNSHHNRTKTPVTKLSIDERTTEDNLKNDQDPDVILVSAGTVQLRVSIFYGC